MPRQLDAVFRDVDDALSKMEGRIAASEMLQLSETVDQASNQIKRLVIGYITDEGKKRIPEASEDILDVFKLLVKGDPSWTAIRDNCRELVYYRNCINMEREDALPAAPAKMAVRTARHVYLYIRTRCVREGRLES